MCDMGTRKIINRPSFNRVENTFLHTNGDLLHELRKLYSNVHAAVNEALWRTLKFYHGCAVLLEAHSTLIDLVGGVCD